MGKIVIFGDSLVQGAFDIEKGGWAKRLEIFFWQKNIETIGKYYEGSNVRSFGIGGDMVSDVLKRFNCEMSAVRGDIDNIIIAIGINDAGFIDGKKANSRENFKKEFKLLVEKAVQLVSVDKIYIVGITNVCEEALKDWFEEKRLIEFDNIIKDVANEYGCNLIPMHGFLTEDDFCKDALHPNAQGHEKMFERIKEFLIKNKII